MTKGFTVGIAALIVLFGGLVWLNKDNSKSSTPALTFSGIQQDQTKGAKLYDVRTPEEYKIGHVENAVNWPLQNIETGSLPDVTKNTKIFVYCESGSRSAQAAALLKNAGYSNVTDLQGLAHVESLGGKLVTN